MLVRRRAVTLPPKDAVSTREQHVVARSQQPLDAVLSPIEAARAEPHVPLPSLGQLPAWVPEGFDLRAAANGMKGLLQEHGVSTTPVHELVLTDADDTVVQTQAKTLLRHRETGELATDPATGALLRIGAELEAERAALTAQFPQLPWADLVNDYREFDDAEKVAHSPPIEVTIDALHTQAAKPDAKRFMITARTSDSALAAFEQLSTNEALGLDAVFSSGRPTELEALGLTGVKLTIPQGKALLIASLVELYRPEQAELEHVTFYDDSDGNLVAAKELLPILFPNTKFEFIDVVRNADGKFEHVRR